MPSTRPASERRRFPALLLVAALAACGGSGDPPAAALPSGARVPVPLGDSPAHGSTTPTWVTIVEFSDFECPFCADAAPTMARLLAAYGDDVQLVYKHFPLEPMHPHARPAAIAAECARVQGRFWELHDQLFAHRAALDDASLAGWAAAAGLDVAPWQACRATPEPGARVDADRALGASLAVRGTPTFFVNGRMAVGAQPYSYFAAAVDAALAEARASGIPRDQYYARAVLGR